MNKYKVEFNLTAQKKGKPKYDFIFGQTEDSALADASIKREEVVAVYFLSEIEDETPAVTEAPVDTTFSVPVDFPVVAPVVDTPTESPSVQGGEFGGGGASGSFDDAPNSAHSFTEGSSFGGGPSDNPAGGTTDTSAGGSDFN